MLHGLVWSFRRQVCQAVVQTGALRMDRKHCHDELQLWQPASERGPLVTTENYGVSRGLEEDVLLCIIGRWVGCLTRSLFWISLVRDKDIGT